MHSNEKVLEMDGSKKQSKSSKKLAKNIQKERELLYTKLENKFEVSQKEIRDAHKIFLKQQPSGEMSKSDFIIYAEREKNIKAGVAESLFRY